MCRICGIVAQLTLDMSVCLQSPYLCQFSLHHIILVTHWHVHVCIALQYGYVDICVHFMAGLETEPKLPHHLMPAVYELIMSTNLNPVHVSSHNTVVAHNDMQNHTHTMMAAFQLVLAMHLCTSLSGQHS